MVLNVVCRRQKKVDEVKVERALETDSTQSRRRAPPFVIRYFRREPITRYKFLNCRQLTKWATSPLRSRQSFVDRLSERGERDMPVRMAGELISYTSLRLYTILDRLFSSPRRPLDVV